MGNNSVPSVAIWLPHFTNVGGAQKVVSDMCSVTGYRWKLYTLSYDRQRIEHFYPVMRNIEVEIVPHVSLPTRLPSRFDRLELHNLLGALAFRRHAKRVGGRHDLSIAHLAFSDVIAGHTGTKTIWYCHCPARYLYEKWIQDEIEGLIGPTPLWAKLIRLILRKMETKAVKKYDKVLCNSEHMQGKIRKYFGVDSEICYPGVDIPNEPISKPGDYFLIFSRLEFYKRVDISIRAMALLKSEPGLKLKIIGEGMAEKSLKELAGSLGVANITFLPFTNDLSAEIKGCMAVIYLPRDEDFGIVPLDAMAYGRPVIGADEGGLRETIINELTGYLIPAEPEAVAAKMMNLWRNPDLAITLGLNGQKHAGSFTTEKFTDTFTKSIRKLNTI